MEYLLFLQDLRNSAGSFVNETILFISEVMGGAGGLAAVALVYWCLNKWAGSLMLLSFSGAYMMNQTLKNIFCVSRPFIKDSRLIPYVQASGYSFPSGHTMLGTAIYASAAVAQRKRKWFVALCAVLTLLTAFGRNWIGVHTPQDVAVGMAVSCGLVALHTYAFRQLEKHPGRDLWFLVAGLLWAVALLLLIPKSGKVCGIYLGSLLGWFAERRWIGFRVEGSLLRRGLRFLGGMGLVLALQQWLLPGLTAPLGDTFGPLVLNFVTFLTVSALWPAVIKAVQTWLPEKNL